MTREKNDRISQAWLTGLLSRVRPEKFPRLDAIIVKPNARRRFQDPEARWRSLSAVARTKQ